MTLKDSIQKSIPGQKITCISYVAAFFLLLIFVSCGPNEKENTIASKITDSTQTVHSTASAVPAITIAAADLSKEYLANEIKADKDYNHKQITVTGTVADIKKSLNGDAYVILAGAEKFTPVQCYLDNIEIALPLKKGDSAKLKGTCTGLHANVIMEKCVPVK